MISSTKYLQNIENPPSLPDSWWSKSSRYSVDIIKYSNNFIDLSVPAISLMQLLYVKNGSNYLSRCSSLNYSSSLLLEQTYEYLNQDFFILPYKINQVNKILFELEAKFSYEQKSLNKQEAKWKNISKFVDEYKRVFEISDEEFWYEHGSELNNIAYEIHTINRAKRLIDLAKIYLEKVRRIILGQSKRYKPNQRKGFRYQIAFSTKNLDDEHNSEVKIRNNCLELKSEFVLHEKEKNSKPFTVNL